MSTPNRYTAGRATIATTTYPVIGFGISPNVIASHVNHSGLANSTQILVAGTDAQRLTFRSPLAAVLTSLGLVPEPQTVVSAVFARTTAGVIDAGTVHSSYAVADRACVWIDEFSVTEGQDCVATVAVEAFSDDGDTEPWTKADNATLPALSAAALHNGIGPVSINGTAIPQVTGIRYSSGFQLESNRTTGLPIPSGAVGSGMQQTMSIDVSDVQAAWAALGGKGLALNGTTGAVINLLRYLPSSGELSSSGQITLTCLNGYASIESNDAEHGSIGSGTITIRGVSAGALSAFVVS